MSLPSVVAVLGPFLGSLLVAAAPGDEQAVAALQPGGELVFELGADDRAPAGPELLRAVLLRVGSDGPVTIAASSSDGDPFLRLLDASGRVIDADDDGGVLWDARLVVDARADRPLRLDAGIKSGTGRLRLAARAGDVPPPSGAAGVLAELDALEARGRAAVARGDPSGAYDLYDAASRLQDTGRRGRARALYEFALPAVEALVRSRPAGAAGVRAVRLLAWTHAGLASQAARATEIEEARRHADEALALEGLLDEPALRVHVDETRASIALLERDVSGAEAILTAALERADALGDALFAVRLRDRLAECAWRQGDLLGARALHDEAVRRAFAASGAFGEALREEASLALVDHLLRRDQVLEAIAVLEGLLARGDALGQRASVLGYLADAVARLGRYDEAWAHAEEALASARELGDASLETEALMVLAELARRCNDLVAARDALVAARALAGGGARAEEVDLRLVMLSRRIEVGVELPATSALRERARAGDDRDLLARTLEASASEAFARGDPEAALSFAEEHLRVVEQASIEHRVGPAHLLVGQLLRRLGRLEEAGREASAGLEAVRRQPDAAVRLDALDLAMRLALDAGDVARARELLAEAGPLLDGHVVDRDVLAGGLRRARDMFSVWSRHAQDLVALRMASARDDGERAALAAEGFLALGASQARTLLEGIDELEAGGRTPEILAARAALERARADRQASGIALARAQQDGFAPDRRVALDDDLRARRAAEEQARAALDALLPAARRVPDAAAGSWEQVAAAALDEHDVLVDFAEGDTRRFVYVVTRGGIAWRDLGESAPIDELVRAFVAGTSRPDRLATPSEVVRLGRALREALVDPWRDVLDARAPDPAAGRLVIVPSAPLASLAFDALVLDGPARPENFAEVVFLGDRRDLVYAPSAPVLARLSGDRGRTSAGAVLVLADPRAPAERGDGERDTPGRRGPPDLGRLPGTRDEALAIARRVLARTGGDAALVDVGEARDAALGDEHVRIFLGREATPARLRDAGGPLRALHCAAHGVVDPDDPSRTGLLLSADGEDDGFLRASDVYGLALDVDVAVLSACDTGGGPLLAGDGVQSLARAFLFAGARSVVASLWQVDDRETRVLMDRFYEGWLDDGLSREAALLRARRELRAAEPRPGTFVGTGRGELLPGARARLEQQRPSLAGHPFFWASFVYIGPPGD